MYRHHLPSRRHSQDFWYHSHSLAERADVGVDWRLGSLAGRVALAVACAGFEGESRCDRHWLWVKCSGWLGCWDARDRFKMATHCVHDIAVQFPMNSCAQIWECGRINFVDVELSLFLLPHPVLSKRHLDA